MSELLSYLVENEPSFRRSATLVLVTVVSVVCLFPFHYLVRMIHLNQVLIYSPYSEQSPLASPLFRLPVPEDPQPRRVHRQHLGMETGAQRRRPSRQGAL